MNKLTDKQKVEAYKWIIGELKKENHFVDFICEGLYRWLVKEKIIKEHGVWEESLDFFPEIEKLKPEDCKKNHAWFGTIEEGRGLRIQILKKEINKLK